MSTRFYAPDLPETGGDYLLEGDEAHHLRTVCRCRVGEEVQLFNGEGRRAQATVASIERHCVYVKLLSFAEGHPVTGLTIACAVPKGDRASVLIEKCTELGVTRLIPLRTERSVTDPKQGKRNRWQRTVIEACKQCGRDDLMEVAEITDWRQFCQQPADEQRFLLHPHGQLITEIPRTDGAVVFAIGPEGGWVDEEVQLAQDHGWTTVRLAGHILRVETAAIAIAAHWQWR